MKKEAVGFIGTGVMGKSMAKNLMDAGHPMNIFTRTRKKAQPLLDAGALWHNSARELASVSDVVISMVGFPEDVEEVYFGAEGVFAGIKPGGSVIEMTTSSPSLAAKIHEEAARKKTRCLDAPVSGGDAGARDGTLAIMVGGDKKTFSSLLHILEVLGSNVVLLGPASSGQHAKMANQIAIASNMVGISESLGYAARAGLDPETVLRSIQGGAAGSWALTNLAPRAITGDLEPGFYIKHFIKDMKIAIESAEEMGINLPGLKLAKNLYEKLSAGGCAELGTQALITTRIKPDCQPSRKF